MENENSALPTQNDLEMWINAHGLTIPVVADDGQFVQLYLQPVGESFSTYIIDVDDRISWVEYGEILDTDDNALIHLEGML